jgi:hypothetical protein
MGPKPRSAFDHLLLRRGLVFGAAAALTGISAAEQVLEFVYPRTHERPTDSYSFKMLNTALAASGRQYTLRLSAMQLSSMRALLALNTGGVNVMDTGASPKVAEGGLILPFPLDLGLSGYRVMLVHRDRLDHLRGIRSDEDLRELSFGQGPDWVDTTILRAAGLKVQEAEFLSLFRMLEAGRFDAFPLGADEASHFLKLFGHLAPSAVLLEDWCLHYRFARVLAVQLRQPVLAEALTAGLSAIFSDGRARAILSRDAHIGPLIDGQQRLPPKIFELDNRLWTAPFQAIPDKLFFRPR